MVAVASQYLISINIPNPKSLFTEHLKSNILQIEISFSLIGTALGPDVFGDIFCICTLLATKGYPIPENTQALRDSLA